MRLSSLVVAVLLFVSPVLFAQRSSGGGGSTSGGSSGGGSSSSGSHGSYSGGSSAGSFSSSSHWSGGSASSISRSSNGSHGYSAGSAAQRQIERNAGGQGHNAAESIKNQQREHRGFLAFLRHPLRKPAPKPAEADLRTICKGKGCLCPLGEIHGKHGGCVANDTTNVNNQCQQGEYWDGGGCATALLFRTNDCGNLALALARQARQVHLTESLRQASCSRDASAQECSELTARSQDEAARYKPLLLQYERCIRQAMSSLPGPTGLN